MFQGVREDLFFWEDLFFSSGCEGYQISCRKTENVFPPLGCASLVGFMRPEGLGFRVQGLGFMRRLGFFWIHLGFMRRLGLFRIQEARAHTRVSTR